MSESLHQPSISKEFESTSARVSLARTGSRISTRDSLDFALAHAQARDAVHLTLSLPSLLEGLRKRNLEVVILKSAAADRATYLRRPDLGRTLSPESVSQLGSCGSKLESDSLPTLAIIFADGLSALAIDRHAMPLLDALLPLIQPHFHLAPVAVVQQARVAIGDPIGHTLQADLTLILIGERPGLSSPDSLGAYLTWAPAPGRTDAERNCVSNIRTEGLNYLTAAQRIAAIAREAHRRQLTGTLLKDLNASLPDEIP